MNPFRLETERLLIRSFEVADLPVIYRILDQTFGEGRLANDAAALRERREWLEWSLLSEKWLAALYQPPYGDRAIVLKSSGELVGAIGYVPLLMPFEQMPDLGGTQAPEAARFTAEVGLFWVHRPGAPAPGLCQRGGAGHDRPRFSVAAAQAHYG